MAVVDANAEEVDGEDPLCARGTRLDGGGPLPPPQPATCCHGNERGRQHRRRRHQRWQRARARVCYCADCARRPEG